MQTKSDVRRAREERRGRELAIAKLAGLQHGFISHRQLREIGLSDGAVKHRMGAGQLRRVHRGVYMAGSPVASQQGDWMASVLACGPGAVLSHRSAAALWSLLPPSGGRSEVTAAHRARSHTGVRVHCCRLTAGEITECAGIPVTSVPRTLLDVATVAPHQLQHAVNEAEVLRLTTWDLVAANLRINAGRRGVARLRAALPVAPAVPGRSELERRFLALVKSSGLPQPETGVLMQLDSTWLECDCLWREARLMVELDGRAFHHTTLAFEQDRIRDRALQAAGWQVVRVTWAQLQNDPTALMADLRHLLK